MPKAFAAVPKLSSNSICLKYWLCSSCNDARDCQKTHRSNPPSEAFALDLNDWVLKVIRVDKS